MRKSTKIVLGFAAVGFMLPLLLLAFYAIADHFNIYPSTTPLFYLAPASIVSMALDNAPRSEAILVWLIIAASNAALYAAPVFVITVLSRFFRPEQDAPKDWLR